MSSIFTPEKILNDKQPLSARAIASFSKTIVNSARVKEPDDFKDSDEDRLRNQPQEMIKGQRSPFKDANTFSVLASDKPNP